MPPWLPLPDDPAPQVPRRVTGGEPGTFRSLDLLQDREGSQRLGTTDIDGCRPVDALDRDAQCPQLLGRQPNYARHGFEISVADVGGLRGDPRRPTGAV